MAAALSDAQLQQVQQQLSAHPEILQAFKDYNDWASHRGRLQYVQKGGPPNPQAVLKQYGINFPDIEDYQIQVDPNGQVGLKREGFLKRNMDWILPVSVIGGGALASTALAGGGSAAAGSSAAADSMAPGAELGATTAGQTAALTGGTAAATTAGTTAGTTAASTGFGAALKSALPAIIGGGASVGGALIASHGNTEAAKITAAANDRALAQAKDIYNQNVARQAPYNLLGTSALGPLSFGLGLPDPNVQAQKDAATAHQGQPIVALGAKDASGNPLPGAGQNQTIPPPPTLAQMGGMNGTSGQSGTVRIQDPATGQIHFIPQSDAQAAIAGGGRPV